MSKRIRKLEAEYSRLMDEKQREICAAALEEFPKGSRVRWVHTYKRVTGSLDSKPVYREGVVVDYTTYELKAKMHTGTVHSVRYSQVESVK